MKSLQWRHTDWTARKYVFQSGLDTIGKLVLGYWDSSAVYLTAESRMAFSEESFWRNTIHVKRDNVQVAVIKYEVFGPYALQLHSGEVYYLKRDFVGRNTKWENEEGAAIASYQPATFSSGGKGTLNFTQSVAEETEHLLAGSGLYLSVLFQRRILPAVIAAFILVVMSGY